MTILQIQNWIHGIVELTMSGSSHEIELDPELSGMAEFVHDCEPTENGLVLTTTDGPRYLVTVTRLPD